MSLSNICTQVFETSIDPYDPDYHWGGASIYPEGPVPTQVEYPGLPAGMTLPPGIPIHLDLFVTPAPSHLAHIPLECPGAPRPDRKPVKSRAVDCTKLTYDQNVTTDSTVLTAASLVLAQRSYMRTRVQTTSAGLTFPNTFVR
ncbi:hypothetical protein BN14_11954 [Rhizoctonia solani AG-1 IB]|uniref:Uncharacterized protein n=1 Tax=Thanatephorus cucumeris (strain AG1-IB / isolate 7/3/14) TaxID=1108050 RepID=M5CET3_THACB|nr:hypothetical protein BN14_11954 [Rhizoctonia solani AG-1 IB]